MIKITLAQRLFQHFHKQSIHKEGFQTESKYEKARKQSLKGNHVRLVTMGFREVGFDNW